MCGMSFMPITQHKHPQKAGRKPRETPQKTKWKPMHEPPLLSLLIPTSGLLPLQSTCCPCSIFPSHFSYYFSTQKNRFTGTIPDWLGELSRLRGLILGENKLRGSIPWQLGHLHEVIDDHHVNFSNANIGHLHIHCDLVLMMLIVHIALSVEDAIRS